MISIMLELIAVSAANDVFHSAVFQQALKDCILALCSVTAGDDDGVDK
jgi:hypothetical protein